MLIAAAAIGGGMAIRAAHRRATLEAPSAEAVLADEEDAL